LEWLYRPILDDLSPTIKLLVSPLVLQGRGIEEGRGEKGRVLE